METTYPTKLKDPRTCRVFFSSPFGGMEGEREELTRKYFPQIHHLCNSRGIQFVPVDMRWGITSEAAENAQTINICLRELDRCDIFVGFYGQRYGWHGAEDEKLQQNFDNAVGLYPWLENFRDRSATELEFLHGHLNNPGAMPACFGFRDKEYDNMKAEGFQKMDDIKRAIKYSKESEEAGEKIKSLRERVANTREKTLGVHMDYSSPEEGAKLMFESFWSHLNKLLQVEEGQMTSRLQELNDHNAFMSTRQAVYIGGEDYFNKLDGFLNTDKLEKVLVTGEAGQGKTALLANWVSHLQETQPDSLLVYHFIGANKNSGRRQVILGRLITELQEALKKQEKDTTEGSSEPNIYFNESKSDNKRTGKEEKNEIEDRNDNNQNNKKNEEKQTVENNDENKSKVTEENENKRNEEMKDNKTDGLDKEPIGKKDGQIEDQTDGQKDGKTERKEEKKEEMNKEKTEEKKDSKKENKNVKELLQELKVELERALKGDKKVVLVIDGLDKMVTVGKTIKPVSWLPSTFPENVKIVLSTKSDDITTIDELVSRSFSTLELQDLGLDHRTQICVKSLEKSGKALSTAQLERVVQKEQTKNPLFLKLVIAELAVFGSFRKLDEKIDYLLSSNSVGELCVKFLERLEIDYNTSEMPDVVQLVLQSIAVSQEGMSETELKDMLNIPSHVWSPLYFALEQFIVVHSNNISFSYSEISEAVNERYLATEEARLAIIKRIIDFFDSQRKSFKVWPRPAAALLQRPAFQLPLLQMKIDDKEGLTTTLSDLNMFHTLIINNEYQLLELWKGTEHQFSWIADCYIKKFDQALADIYCDDEDQYNQEEVNKPPGQRILYHMENVRFLMDTASCVDGSTKVIQRIIQLLENTEGVWQGSERMELLMEMKYYLACNMCDTEHYDYAVENHQNVIKYWKDALEAKEVEEKKAESRLAWAYNGLGLTHYHKKEFKEAKELFKRSLDIHAKQENARNLADCWTNIGLVYLGKKEHNDAISSFKKALKLYEEHFFDSVPHCIGNLYTNLGLAYRRQNDLNQAEKYYLKSLELKANAVGWDHPVIATAYMNLGTLETHRKNYAKVEEYTKKAIEVYKINQLHEDSREYRMCRENLANCYLRQERYEDAIPVYWSVFNVLTRLNLMCECLPWVHHTMASHYIDLEDYEKADTILAAMARCPQKRSAKTFLLLEKVNTKWPRPDPPEDLSFDYGLKLFPYNADMVKQKTMMFIAQGDIDGLMKWYTSWEAESLDYFTAIEWCREENKPGFASEIVELCLKKFPDVETLIGYAAGHWFEVKQYDKALACVEKMKLEEDYNETADFNCATVLHHFGREEDARKWLKKVLSVIVPKDLKTKVAELKEKLGGDAAIME